MPLFLQDYDVVEDGQELVKALQVFFDEKESSDVYVYDQNGLKITY